MKRPLRVAIAALFAIASSAPSAGRASEVDVCIDAADRSQPLRAAGKLRAARALLVQCNRPVCPSAIRSSCKGWLTEVDTVLPTVILRAHDASGRTLNDVRVTVDREVVAESLDEAPVRLDPGDHVIRFERAGESDEQRVVLVSGEREHVVTGVFPAPPPVHESNAPPPPVSPPPVQRKPEQPEAGDRSVPVLSWVLGGVAIAAAGTATFFYVSGLSDGSDLRDSCGKTQLCAQSDRDDVRTKLIVGDVLAGVAVVSLVAAVWIAISSSGGTRTRTAALTF